MMLSGETAYGKYPVEAVRRIVADGHIGIHERIAYLTGNSRGARALEILTPAEIFDEK